MAVIRALGYKQVGGYADEAADAASSPAGAEAKRTPETKQRGQTEIKAAANARHRR